MAVTDYYQLKEIILGFRDCYLDGNRLLERAKSYLEYNEKQIQDILFYVDRHLDRVDLSVEFLTQPELFDDVKSFFANLLRYSFSESKIATYTLPKLPVDIIQTEDCRCHAKILDNEKLHSILYQYFNLPFFQDIQNEFSSVDVCHKLITQSDTFSYDSDILSLSYSPSEDSFSVDAFENSILQGLNEAFDTLFFSEQFSLPMQEVISSYQEEFIPVRISPELAEFTRGKVQVLKHSKQLVFCKKK